MNKRKTGDQYEKIAADYLQKQGCKILEHSFRNRFGEIDLIVKDGDCVVFTEVKYRKTAAEGHPLEAVTLSKQKTICKVADYYRVTHGIGEFDPIRFDVIGILGDEISWVKNAFYYHRPGR